jgi:hypothetical protein
MTKVFRHGDIVLKQIEKLPDGLKEKKTKVILQSGSSGNPHLIDNGKLYFINDDDFIIGYLEAKNTNLIHREHGNKKVGSNKYAKISDGLYEIRRQVEYTPEGLRQVED